MISTTPIPFEEFMRRALHDPRHGYYSRHITAVGARGDFTTAPQLSSLPAIAIARWASRALRESRCRALIEIGPGSGRLASGVRASLPWLQRQRTRLHLVESSAPLAAIQKKLLGNSANWHPSPAAALAACGGRAVIFSNELVDAFPVRRFKKTPGGWAEMFVQRDAQGIVRETFRETCELPDSSSFSVLHATGQLIEVHESYRSWLRDWLPLWKSGRMLTIDYGDTAERIYQRRPAGSLRAYLLQQRLEGPGIYQNPGRQDLTADVNFTDLERWSAPWAATIRFGDLGMLIPEMTRENHGSSPYAADLSEIAGYFKVLEQQVVCDAGRSQ